MAKKKDEKLTLEEALGKLEEAVTKLQSDEISLEESFQVYQQGMEYVKFCSQTIDQVEKKVLMLNQEGGLDELAE
ncbi:MAG: exodeoxyribonuclease VII small subunit [Lachnospiraceae bacterium]|nr:exodeoxyribonuclease VII small subunit [Lachnospiraceae bacterium]